MANGKIIVMLDLPQSKLIDIQAAKLRGWTDVTGTPHSYAVGGIQLTGITPENWVTGKGMRVPRGLPNFTGNLEAAMDLAHDLIAAGFRFSIAKEGNDYVAEFESFTLEIFETEAAAHAPEAITLAYIKAKGSITP